MPKSETFQLVVTIRLEDVQNMLKRGEYEVPDLETIHRLLKDQEFREILADDLQFCWDWMNNQESNPHDDPIEAIIERYGDVLDRLKVSRSADE